MKIQTPTWDDYNTESAKYQTSGNYVVQEINTGIIFTKTLGIKEKIKELVTSLFKFIFDRNAWEDVKNAWSGRKCVVLLFPPDINRAQENSRPNTAAQKVDAAVKQPNFTGQASRRRQAKKTELLHEQLTNKPVPAPQKHIKASSSAKATEISDPIPKVNTGSKVVFSKLNQFNVGGPSGCNIASLLFATSKEPLSPEMLDGVLTKMSRNPTLSDMAKTPPQDPDLVETEVARAFGEETIMKFSTETQYKKTNLHFDFIPNAYQFKRATGMQDAINDFIQSEAQGAIFLTFGATMGLRKRDGYIELYDPHGEVEHLKQYAKVPSNITTNCSFAIKFQFNQVDKLTTFINKLYPIMEGVTAEEGGDAIQNAQMFWYA